MSQAIKIIVISDTHIFGAEVELPLKLLEEIKKADILIHAGDFVSLQIFEKLKSLCNNFHAVWGNMDSSEIRSCLPEKDLFRVGDYKIGIVHGCGAPNKINEFLDITFKNEKLDIVVFGHTHTALNEKRGSTLFINPGSPTDKIYSKYNSYGVIEINDKIQSRIIKI